MAAGARHRVLDAVRITLSLLVLAAVAVALARNWSAVSADLRRVDAWSLTLAFVLVCLAPALTLLGWRRLLADLGSPLHLAPAGGIFFVGQLGKYLPGSVWSVVAQAEMGARLHIPRRRSAVVGLVSLMMAVLCAVVVGLPAVPLLVTGGDTGALGWAVLLVLPLVAVLFSPRLLNRLIATGLRLARREPLEHSLSAPAVLQVVALFLGAWLAAGAHAWVLARAVGGASADPQRLAVATVSGFALASAVAMFSVLLPAGVGVREGLLVLLLAPVTSLSAATAVVVLARFLTVLADVAFALAGWGWARSHHLVTSRAERRRDHIDVAPESEGSSR